MQFNSEYNTESIKLADKTLTYVIITPAKNEGNYIEHTIKSICNQTLRPEEWIIVDDGSTDDTTEIVKKYSGKYDWIRLISKSNYTEKRSGGSKVVKAFETGQKNLNFEEYDFIVKLDADLTVPDDYFESVANEFQKNNSIGICGGVCVLENNGSYVEEWAAEFHIRGAVKSYRKECFQDIGGLMPVFSWDVIDEYLAMYKGWKLRRLNDLKVIHHRETGTETGQLRYSMKMGDFCYKIGYDPFLTLLRSLRRIFDKKINMVSGIGIWAGYLKAINSKKLLSKEHRKFIRKFQYSRIKRMFSKVLKF